MKRNFPIWLEGNLIVKRLESDTLPVLFSPREDFDVYFTVLAPHVTGHRIQRLEQLKELYLLSRELYASGKLMEVCEVLKQCCIVRKDLFLGNDYQVKAAVVHLVVTAIQFGAFELNRGELDKAHHLFTFAEKQLIEGTVDEPLLECLVANAFANYWYRRERMHLLLTSANKALTMFLRSKTNDLEAEWYFTVRTVAALAFGDHHEKASGLINQFLKNVKQRSGGKPSSSVTAAPLDLMMNASVKPNAILRKVTLLCISDSPMFSTALSIHTTCSWMMSYCMAYCHACSMNFKKAATILEALPKDANDTWLSQLRSLLTWCLANDQGTELSRFRMNKNIHHNNAYKDKLREMMATHTEFVSGGGGKAGIPVLATTTTSTQDKMSSESLHGAPVTPITKEHAEYLETLLVEGALEWQSKEGHRSHGSVDTQVQYLEAMLSSLEEKLILTEDRIVQLKEAAGRYNQGWAKSTYKLEQPHSAEPTPQQDNSNNNSLGKSGTDHPAEDDEAIPLYIDEFKQPFSNKQNKDYGVTLTVKVLNDPDAMLDAFYGGSYKTMRNSTGPEITVTDTSVSAIKKYNLVPECHDLREKQRILRTILPTIPCKDLMYRQVQQELSENEAILAQYNKVVHEKELQFKASALSKTIAVIRALGAPPVKHNEALGVGKVTGKLRSKLVKAKEVVAARKSSMSDGVMNGCIFTLCAIALAMNMNPQEVRKGKEKKKVGLVSGVQAMEDVAPPSNVLK
eukprot:PhF_6_TR8782/c0_g1_i1/m.13916